jgi:hypothetical protein
VKKLLIDRRQFLRGLGIGAAALAAPFCRVASAQEVGAPKRFIFMMTANGFQEDGYVVGGTGATFTLGPTLRALEPFRSKLLLLRGLDNEASYEGPGGAHQKGVGAWLTGRPLNDGDFTGGNGDLLSGWASGISIDQRIANVIGSETRLPSLELGVQVRGASNRHRVSYTGSDAPLPPDSSPQRVYGRLFGAVTGDDAALARLRRRRQSVIDLARGDLSRLHGQLGVDDRPALEAHLERIRELERQLDVVATSCDTPGEPATFDPMREGNYEQAGTLQIDLLVAAMACDITRVSTLLWSGGTSGQRFPSLGFGDAHHPLSHDGDGNAASQTKLRQIDRFHAERFAHLLARLDGTPEPGGGGGTMLDNTVVVWGSELSKGNTHSRRDMPIVMAGGLGGYFRTGRALRFAGEPHNDLLLTILHGFGIRDATFGVPRLCSGPIARLLR